MYITKLFHLVLNAYENNHLSTTRHRCSHVEIVAPNDIPRFATLNVVADAQVRQHRLNNNNCISSSTNITILKQKI